MRTEVEELRKLLSTAQDTAYVILSKLDAPARAAYHDDLREQEKTSTIHSNRWAKAWSELTESEKDHWRQVAAI